MKEAEILKKNREKFGKIIDLDISKENYVVFDFTKNNEKLKEIDFNNFKNFDEYINYEINKNKSKLGIGRYAEDRVIYDHSDLFHGINRRTIHLGIDLWTLSGTKVFAPIGGKIHSFNFNNAKGDYGPTIILEHLLDGLKFHTLYGHLSLDSLNGLKVGAKIKKNQQIGKIGNHRINGDWPSHLHFQIILDIGKKKGDYPGVCSIEDRDKFLKICPDPNIILNIEKI